MFSVDGRGTGSLDTRQLVSDELALVLFATQACHDASVIHKKTDQKKTGAVSGLLRAWHVLCGRAIVGVMWRVDKLLW